MTARASLAALCLLMAGCGATSDPQAEADWRGDPGSVAPNAAGLVSLPCDGSRPLKPAKAFYCRRDRHYVTPAAREALVDAAEAVAHRFPGTAITFMDASGPEGRVPFEPHLSHGDGRQVDLAVFYADRAGHALAGPPESSRNGYGAYEPPRAGDPLPCAGIDRPNDDRDPPADRTWRLDDPRTQALVEVLAADRRVRRILIEPHLERRFGMEGHPKLRFAGCQAARHDDHLHVDFH